MEEKSIICQWLSSFLPSEPAWVKAVKLWWTINAGFENKHGLGFLTVLFEAGTLKPPNVNDKHL